MGHTQGPWKHEVRIKRGTYGQPVKGSPDHHYISGPRPAVNSCEPIICNLGPMNGHTEANAKLIAAAPELLEACKEVLSVLPVLWGDQVKNGKITLSIDESVFYQLESAINKAKGA
jgi:hypothetical protein